MEAFETFLMLTISKEIVDGNMVVNIEIVKYDCRGIGTRYGVFRIVYIQDIYNMIVHLNNRLTRPVLMVIPTLICQSLEEPRQKIVYNIYKTRFDRERRKYHVLINESRISFEYRRFKKFMETLRAAEYHTIDKIGDNLSISDEKIPLLNKSPPKLHNIVLTNIILNHGDLSGSMFYFR